MEEISRLLNGIFNIDFIRAVISNPRAKEGIIKIKVRPVESGGRLRFQFESFTKTQAFHENLDAPGAVEKMLQCMENFRQIQLDTVEEEDTILISRKGKVTVKRKKRKEKAGKANLSHNRKKKYILEEGIPVPFLQDLGVMTQDGRIVRTKTDKFRQINRFLEFIEDILPELPQDRQITILDFGCGKSYLTFAMYYYLHELKGYDIRIIGLDLKKDVILHCGELAVKYGYENLTFLEGDIAEYEGTESVDMVVTLHACDTATDHALAKAVGWDAKVILSVPCCQHEINIQLSDRRQTAVPQDNPGQRMPEDVLAPVLDYGLLRERFAALATDGLRAKYLESVGYETRVLEFIDMEHTPKNILIRGIKRTKGNKNISEEIVRCEEFLGIHPALGRLLTDKGENKTR